MLRAIVENMTSDCRLVNSDLTRDVPPIEAFPNELAACEEHQQIDNDSSTAHHHHELQGLAASNVADNGGCKNSVAVVIPKINSRGIPQVIFNLRFSKHLRRLERAGAHMQYQIACLSTLGGAYHLCDDPKTALLLARKQEVIGHIIKSSTIVIRSRAFQAVNFGLLGNKKASKRMMRDCKQRAERESHWSNITAFVDAVDLWISQNVFSKTASADRIQPLRLTDNIANSIGGLEGLIEHQQEQQQEQQHQIEQVHEASKVGNNGALVNSLDLSHCSISSRVEEL